MYSCSQSVSLCHSLLSTLDDPSNALALAQVASLKRHVTPSAHHIHPTKVTTSHLQGKYGVEIRIESVNKVNSHSRVRISHGLNKFVTDFSVSILAQATALTRMCFFFFVDGLIVDY